MRSHSEQLPELLKPLSTVRGEPHHSHRALALCHPTKDRAAAARALELLGCGLQALGKWEDANDEWQQAVELLTEIDDPYADQIRAQIAKLSPPAQHVKYRVWWRV